MPRVIVEPMEGEDFEPTVKELSLAMISGTRVENADEHVSMLVGEGTGMDGLYSVFTIVENFAEVYNVSTEMTLFALLTVWQAETDEDKTEDSMAEILKSHFTDIDPEDVFGEGSIFPN